MSLSEEIRKKSKTVHTTDVSMSIGEIINMYKDNEIIIKPEFQRLFRWSIEQKSKFIESILIGIPIPSIFVQQLKNGQWEVIDGLQRISTLLEFAGVLVNADSKIVPRSILIETKFLPSLKNITYEDFMNNPHQENSDNYFDMETKLVFKKTRLFFQILNRSGDSTTKYELFNRLNSGSTQLTDQEIRSAIYLNEKPKAITLIKELSQNSDFINTTNLSDRNIEEAYNEELVLRFFAYSTLNKTTKVNSIKDFLDNYLENLFDEDNLMNMKNSFDIFFKFLNDNFNSDSFRGKRGGFTISKFEVLTIGLYPYINKLEIDNDEFIKKIKNIDAKNWFIEATAKRSFARKRLELYIKNAPNYFNGE